MCFFKFFGQFIVFVFKLPYFISKFFIIFPCCFCCFFC
nr:MAG TPA: hypothetical protein [Crassvirales sp.]